MTKKIKPSTLSGLQKKQKKKSAQLKLCDIIPALEARQKILYGFDMSFRNPGLCKLNLHEKTISLISFRNRKQEKCGSTLVSNSASPFHGWLVEVITIEPMMDDEEEKGENDNEEKAIFDKTNFDNTRFERYKNKLIQLLSFVGDNRKNDKLVALEHYSFNSQATGSSFMLTELGGCIRMFLHLLKHNIIELSPMSVKKKFSGKGNADKDFMLSAYEHYYRLPDLYELMGLDGSKYKHAPHPVEDLCDALAVCLSILTV